MKSKESIFYHDAIGLYQPCRSFRFSQTLKSVIIKIFGINLAPFNCLCEIKLLLTAVNSDCDLLWDDPLDIPLHGQTTRT